MTLGRKLLIAFAVLIVIVGIAYAWGASGRGALQQAADDAKQALDLAEARGAILEGRVSLYSNNFGDASRHFEQAKDPLQRLKGRFDDAGNRDGVTGVDTALQHVAEAQRLAAKLDVSAQNAAGQAMDALKTLRR